jgi:cytochrome c oxidase subunit II
MSGFSRSWLVAAVLVLAALVLTTGTLFIAAAFFPSQPMQAGGPGWRAGLPFTRSFSSNGERIFFTGSSESGPPVSAQMQGMHRMPAGRMACADCHGPDGRGGVVRMMMSSFDAPDIRYHSLTEEEHAGDPSGHPPYTDADIKRAVTEGVDPAGEPLEWIMPRWTMTDAQLDDLIAFLKTLE